MPHTYPPSPEVWGLTMPAQRAEVMAASTEEPCLASTWVPSAVQRAASVTTAPRWNSCNRRGLCWPVPDLLLLRRSAPTKVAPEAWGQQ